MKGSEGGTDLLGEDDRRGARTLGKVVGGAGVVLLFSAAGIMALRPLDNLGWILMAPLILGLALIISGYLLIR